MGQLAVTLHVDTWGSVQDLPVRPRSNLGGRRLELPPDACQSMIRVSSVTNDKVTEFLAEVEADLVRERTMAGLAAALARGARLGRPCALGPEQLEIARSLLANPKLSARQVAAQLGVHRATRYRSLARAR